jgi:hypothetical protein
MAVVMPAALGISPEVDAFSLTAISVADAGRFAPPPREMLTPVNATGPLA